MEDVRRIERGNLTAVIRQDEFPENPREWDNLGKMVCWHRRYKLGDEQPKQPFREWLRELAGELVGANDVDLIPDEHIERILAKHVEMIPLGLLDHSGLTMYAGGGAHPLDSGGWDSGTVGVIYATREKIIKEYGDDSPESRKKARECMLAEVEVYDQYLTGDVYYYAIIDESGVILDSCGGFFGIEDAEEEAERMLTFLIEKECNDAAECEAVMHV